MSKEKYFISYKGWVAVCDEMTNDGVYCSKTRDGITREEAQEAILKHIKEVHRGDDNGS